MAHRVLVMKDGRVVREGRVEEVLSDRLWDELK
jgi:ABC-type microcin C transport system duplicated ATPase subunit YejF